MSNQSNKPDMAKRRRRYLLQLSSAPEADDSAYQYVARIQPWKSGRKAIKGGNERFFPDEFALIETINPLLPRGSDVRDVLGHIESNDGFFYLLHLSQEEARQLGWMRNSDD